MAGAAAPILAIVLAALAGALFAGIAGILRAHGRRARGDHDDHAQLDRVLGRAAACSASAGRSRARRRPPCRSRTTSSTSAHLHVFWGDPVLQGLHIGFFIALVALVVYWIDRSTGRRSATRCARSASTPRRRATAASRSPRNYFLAMAISGAFAGLAGAIDILGWEFRLNDERHPGLDDRLHRDRGRAARPQHGGRRLLRRRCSSARSLTGTSTRNLDPEIFRPELASNLTLLIQGLVVLFVGADVLDPLPLAGCASGGRRRGRGERPQ